MATNQTTNTRELDRLASLDEKEAAAQIHLQAENEVGKYGADVVAAREENLKAELASYKEIHGFDNVVMNFAKNQVGITANADNKNGFNGVTYSAQQQIPFPEKAGAVWLKGGLNQSADGKLSGNAGFNYVGKAGTFNNPITGKRIDYVPIAAGELGINDNGQIKAENASVLAGIVMKEHENDDKTHNVNHTAFIAGNTKGASAFYRASKQFDIGSDSSITGYGQGSYGTNGKLNLGGGAQFNKSLGNGNEVAVEVSAGVDDVTGDHTFNAALTGRWYWGAPEKKSETQQRFEKAVGKSPSASAGDAKPFSQLGAAQGVDKNHGYGDSTAKSKPEFAQVDIAKVQSDVSRELKSNYSEAMKHAYEFYKELANQPQAQQEFLAQISENLARLNPVLYENAADAQRSLHARFEIQVYVDAHQQGANQMS